MVMLLGSSYEFFLLSVILISATFMHIVFCDHFLAVLML